MTLNTKTKVMLDKFLSYIHTQKLFNYTDRILLAVSGGIDSSVLLHMFVKAKMDIGVCHVNHHLRGEASDMDAEFVSHICSESGIPFYCLHLDPSDLNAGNMQKNARNRRYEWFQILATKEHYDYIATAHHADDNAETFLINIMRGSGLDGLQGIAPKSQNIIRPLLFASRGEIENYAFENNISYREDQSNATDKYLRNRVRHHIIPEMVRADQRALTGLAISVSNIGESKNLLDFLMENYIKNYVQHQEGNIHIDLGAISASGHGDQIIYHVLKPYHFNYSQCKDIIRDINQTGNVYNSEKYEAFINRGFLILRKTKLYLSNEDTIEISPPCKLVINKLNLQFEWTDEKSFTVNPNEAQYLDAETISQSLVIRKWQSGDRFAPLGMNGKTQKLKDFLIGQKIPLFDKDDVFVLVDGKRIVCILRHRIADSVKITDYTTKILKISFLPYP